MPPLSVMGIPLQPQPGQCLHAHAMQYSLPLFEGDAAGEPANVDGDDVPSKIDTLAVSVMAHLQLPCETARAF